MRHLLLALVAALMLPSAAAADDARIYDYDGSFEDAVFGVENAIVNRGLVVDFVSHVGEMLARTRQDVGSDKTLFANADIFMFCSAVLSRRMMEADPANIAQCPYSIFVTEAGDGSGRVQIGYRLMPDGPMKEVETLLDEIAREVVGG